MLFQFWVVTMIFFFMFKLRLIFDGLCEKMLQTDAMLGFWRNCFIINSSLSKTKAQEHTSIF